LRSPATTAHWWFCRDLLEAGQLKGLKHRECNQFCRRTYDIKSRVIFLQTKAEFKSANSNQSPDDADAVVGLAYIAARSGLSHIANKGSEYQAESKEYEAEDEEYSVETAYSNDPYQLEMADFN